MHTLVKYVMTDDKLACFYNSLQDCVNRVLVLMADKDIHRHPETMQRDTNKIILHFINAQCNNVREGYI